VLLVLSRGVVDALQAKFEAVLPRLDERQQRLVMAGEGRSLGRNGGPPVTPTRSRFTTSKVNWARPTPYGVYDLAADTGWVSVGADQATAEFAVETNCRWWNTMGASVYPPHPGC